MIRGHPLRKTGSAASHGGLSTELFYYKLGRLATGKKQMWRVSQKIHRGSLAFFGKWDKINRIRGDDPAPEVRRRAESPSHGFAVPAPFRQGGLGGRIATTSLRTGLAMTQGFAWGIVCGGTHGSRPTLFFVGQGPCALPGVRYKVGGRPRGSPLRREYKKCGKAGRCRHRLLRMGRRGVIQMVFSK